MDQTGSKFDYLHILWRNRKLLAYFVIGSLILGSLIVVLGPKRYKLNVFIKMGKVLEREEGEFVVDYIENSASVAEILVAFYDMRNATALLPAHIVAVTLYGFTKEAVMERLKLIDKGIIQEHKKEYDRVMKYPIQEIENIQKRMLAIQDEIETIKNSKKPGGSNPVFQVDPMGNSILLSRQDTLFKLESQYNQLNSLVESKVVHPTVMVIQDDAKEPKRDLKWPAAIIAFCLFGGLMTGIILIVVKDLVELNGRHG